ncbi:hypothetical protein N7456_001248 [Penicillium angulare]|uniref:GST N-terminal domain-containing protein n=1 Tax=Penicillium angulare TaxID=116970 RepID=A0A9W9KSW5_9EURO|nr:hypothetical protein N7456_001248 [Penicillium angulare]
MFLPPTITLYDIAFQAPTNTSNTAPNPWKSRLALNFKGLPHKTEWVPLLQIPETRKRLGSAPGRKFADGSDFYTLPLVTDSSTNSIIGDTIDFAIHLQRTYPDAGAGNLFPAQKLEYTYTPEFDFPAPLSEHAEGEYGEYVRFNTNVDNVFSAHCVLMVGGYKFDPSDEEAVKAEFVRRSGVPSWDSFLVEGEARDKTKASFHKALEGLADLLKKDPSGPFILGHKPNYADLIVGGWLQMTKMTLPADEWKEFTGWYDGVFGQLSEALQQFTHVY